MEKEKETGEWNLFSSIVDPYPIPSLPFILLTGKWGPPSGFDYPILLSEVDFKSLTIIMYNDSTLINTLIFSGLLNFYLIDSDNFSVPGARSQTFSSIHAHTTPFHPVLFQ